MTPDHRNENLRRKSFAAQALPAANFGEADLREADFTMEQVEDERAHDQPTEG